MLIEVAFSGKVRVFWIIFFAKGWSALYAIEMRKLEEELEVEVKVSVGCDPDERIDDDVEPCEVDPEELRHYVALKRQYHYLGFDDLCKIPGFSGVLRRTRLRSPRGLVESSEKKEGAAGCHGGRAGGRYDDWKCHRCHYLVFAKWKKFPKCGMLRARSV